MFGLSKAQKQEKEKQEKEWLMSKYELEDLEDEDLIVLNRIAEDLIESRFLEDHHKKYSVNYLSVIEKQNWLIIKQLGRLNKNLSNLKKS